MKKNIFTLFVTLIISTQLFAQLLEKVKVAIDKIEATCIEWRHHLHQYPELGNSEYKTAAYITGYLKSLGLDVQTGIAKTGVVALLKGDNPGACIALRADMDALPLLEKSGLSFASKEKRLFVNDSVPVMHACGHDAHVAILMAVAKILSDNKKELHGSVKFIFQPAEEGPPPGEEGGAKRMVEEGALENPKPSAIYGLHIRTNIEVGKIEYKPAAFMASADEFSIKIKGKGTHGSSPWNGVDPVVVASQIVEGLQTIVSRESELTKGPVIISVGKIQGGIRWNIIPDEVLLEGTIRTFDNKMQQSVHEKIKRKADGIAASAGATVEIKIETRALVTYNPPDLAQKASTIIANTIGAENIQQREWITGGEDFSYYGTKVPSFFFFLGGMPKGFDPAKAPSHHTSEFYIEDAALKTGIQALCGLVLESLKKK